MFKKVISIGLLLVMLFSLAGCERYPVKPKIPGFHNLETAYKKGWISKTNLKSIASLYNERVQYPGALNEETKNKIVDDYLAQWDLENLENAESYIDSIIITYYGIYNDCVVLIIKSDFIMWDISPVPKYYIGGVLFRYYVDLIDVWIQGD